MTYQLIKRQYIAQPIERTEEQYKKSVQLAINSLAPSTQKTYKCAYETFLRCGFKELTPDNVVNFIESKPHRWIKQKKTGEYRQSDKLLTPATITAYVSALANLEYQMLLTSNIKFSQDVKNALKILKRTSLHKITQATPLPADLMHQYCADTKNTIRNRTIIGLGYLTASRREELAALNVGDLYFNNGGVTVSIRRSKTDKEGKGYKKFFKAANPNAAYCIVTLLKQQVAGAEKPTDALFLSHSGRRIQGRDISRLIDKSFSTEKVKYSGHSLRAGIVTELAHKNITPSRIAEITGHKNLATLQIYIREATGVKTSAANEIIDDIPTLPPQNSK